MKTDGARSLPDKLGLRPELEVAVFHAPEHYPLLLGPVWETLVVNQALPGYPLAWIHYFASHAEDLDAELPSLRDALQPTGQLWVSWQKGQKANGGLHEDAVRTIGLSHGLVDVKVAAIDSVWSGLKFVVRLRDRPKGDA